MMHLRQRGNSSHMPRPRKWSRQHLRIFNETLDDLNGMKNDRIESDNSCDERDDEEEEENPRRYEPHSAFNLYEETDKHLYAHTHSFN